MTPELAARTQIDAKLEASGWAVQNYKDLNLAAGRGIAVREFPLRKGHGVADYLLYVDKRVLGVVEAKKLGETLTGVEAQTEKYSAGLPEILTAPICPLPFLYQSTGVETRYTNSLDPDPTSREIFSFHRPESLADLIQLAKPPKTIGVADPEKPYGLSTLTRRLQTMPPINGDGMRDCQITAIANLEKSLREGRRRSLLQMQTGSGKTYTAVAQSYRLLRYAGAKKILFLVDRDNLSEQTETEFQQYTTPDDGRKFTELYNVQRLKSNRIDPVAKVVITTIQRLYSILRGEENFDEANEIESVGGMAALIKTPKEVEYNPNVPIELFDFVWTDECHRSIYNLWRQVLEYFDASLIGLTATPSKQTLGFFQQNLVMEYGHAQAVVDKVNVDFVAYRIKTKITEDGGKVDAGFIVDKRERKTRKVRWQELDSELTYTPNQLDRAIVVPDQIRTVIRAFRDQMLPECFPERTEVPKTLIFAKDDSHADDIVRILREEFGKGNAFCEKITYKTSTARIVNPKTGEVTYQNTNITPKALLSSFRTAYNPRIAVTVDMIATGTDIKPLEIVFFMRDVQSANYFEQMKGRGCRTIEDTDLQAVTPGKVSKTRYILVDAVGVTERDRKDSIPLERQPTVALKTILQAVGAGSTDPEVVSTLASRLLRLDKVISDPARHEIEQLAGKSLVDLAKGLVAAVTPDQIEEAAGGESATPEMYATTEAALMDTAVAPFYNAQLRNLIANAQQDAEQTIANTEQDTLVFAGASPEATERARNTITSFAQYLEDNRDEIEAVSLLYAKRRGQAPTLRQLKALAETLGRPPRAWTPDLLWRAYETLEASKVRGHGGKVVTDLVSLVRFALNQETILSPFAETVDDRFVAWVAAQRASGRNFTEEEMRWLEMIRDHIKTSVTVDPDDFDLSPFVTEGGLGRAYQIFGDRLNPLLRELNEVLAD
jgi:type I restriction enzyme, R subunit